MCVSYNKLFKLLIDRKMKKKDLMYAAEISPSSMAKLGKDEYVSLEVLVKICGALSADSLRGGRGRRRDCQHGERGGYAA